MPTGVLVVMMVGFLNVCLGYAFAQYFWPSLLMPSTVEPKSAASAANVGESAVRRTSPARATAQPPAKPAQAKESPVAMADQTSTAISPDTSADDRTTSARSQVQERVANKVHHLYKRLQRLSQQIRQLGDSPDAEIAGTLHQRIERVARGGIEDLRYAVESAQAEERPSVTAVVDSLSQQFTRIVDSIAELTFEDDALQRSIAAMIEATDALVTAIAGTSEARGPR